MWLEKYDADGEALPTSAKLEALDYQLQTWLQDSPDEKVIIFIQWVQFGTVIGRILEKAKVEFVYLTVSHYPSSLLSPRC